MEGEEGDASDPESESKTDFGFLESTNWEVCINEEGEEGEVIKKKKQTCKKCHGNNGFISIKDLRLDNLPANCRNETGLEWIHHIAELTVKIKITYKPKPSARMKCTFNGTGFVVALVPRDDNNRPTKLEDGQLIDSPRQTEVSIFTAEHVIRASLVEKIEVLFFFDDFNEPKRMKVVEGEDPTTDLQKDFCRIVCLSADQEFVGQLKHHLDRVRHISKFCPSATNISFIVSHPHGWEKQVSFGTWWEENAERDSEKPMKLMRLGDSLYGVFKNTVYYNIPTCPGSSGARVMLFRHQDYEYTYHLASISDKIGLSAYSLKKMKLQEHRRQPMDIFNSWKSSGLK